VKSKTCKSCGIEFKNAHGARRRCEPCAIHLRYRPVSKLSDEQLFQLPFYIGNSPIEAIAVILKTSRSNLRRWARDNGVSFKYFGYSLETKKMVSDYYEVHGRRKTEEQFPDVKVRSIVERLRAHSPRRVRWTDKQLVELLKMSCFVSFETQARYFNRPRANAGSIKSAWSKNFKCKPSEMHGMPNNKARYFIDKKCPFIKTPFMNVDVSESAPRKLFLWVDMENHLLPDCPTFIKQGIKTMAEYQRWLFRPKDVHSEIANIMQRDY